MNINLTWDLFIIVFFSVIIAYSFIIGKNKTIKLIISSYLALLAADGLGNLVYKYIIGPSPIFKVFNVGTADKLMITFKIAAFIIAIVLISIKGGFEVDSMIEKSAFFRTVSTFVFGFLNAGLIVSTILIYTSGISFLSAGASVINTSSFSLYSNSELVRAMVDNFNLWFSLPAIAFIATSVLYVSAKE